MDGRPNRRKKSCFFFPFITWLFLQLRYTDGNKCAVFPVFLPLQNNFSQCQVFWSPTLVINIAWMLRSLLQRKIIRTEEGYCPDEWLVCRYAGSAGHNCSKCQNSLRNRDSAMVRALASQQCGPGSIIFAACYNHPTTAPTLENWWENKITGKKDTQSESPKQPININGTFLKW